MLFDQTFFPSLTNIEDNVHEETIRKIIEMLVLF